MSAVASEFFTECTKLPAGKDTSDHMFFKWDESKNFNIFLNMQTFMNFV